MHRPFVRIRRRVLSLMASAFALVAAVPSQASAQFSSLWFFGDSFTDTGNATGLALAGGLGNPTAPPYAAGRFSNGPVWSELFAGKLRLSGAAAPAWFGSGGNYAVGGATTGALGSFASLTGMLAQGARYAKDSSGVADQSGLYVLWGGANEVSSAVALIDPLERLGAMRTAVSNIALLANGLYAGGARNFLFPLLPDVGATPLFGTNPADAAIASSLTDTFNQLLGASIQQLSFVPGVNAYGLSLNNLLTNIQRDADTGGRRYGITDTTTPCFLLLAFNPQACSSALFVDQLHATTVVQQLIADAAYDRVVNGRDVAVVPEPSTVLLVAGGLMIVGMLGRRRNTA